MPQRRVKKPLEEEEVPAAPRRQRAVVEDVTPPVEPKRHRKAEAADMEPPVEPKRRKKAEAERETEPKTAKKAKKRAAELAEPTKSKAKKKGAWKIPVIVALIIVALLVAGVLTLSVLASRVDTIYDGLTVEGIDLSGMTQQQASDALEELGHQRYDAFSVTAEMPLDHTLTISAQEAGIRFSAQETVMAAWNYGRSEGLLRNMLRYAQCRFLDKNGFAPESALQVSLNEEAIRTIIQIQTAKINEALLENGTVIDLDKGEIRITKGASSLTIDEEQVYQLFKNAFLTADSTPLVYESDPVADENYDFQKLYDEIHSEVKEAQLVYAVDYTQQPEEETEGEATPAPTPTPTPAPTSVPEKKEEPIDFKGQPYAIIPSVVGKTFDVKEAERLWAAAGYGDEVVIPLKVTVPVVQSEDIEGMLFRDRLSKNWTMVRLWGRDYCEEVRTSLAGSTQNRISNVKKACELLNGTILVPGQTFSYNDALGQRTEANGWLPAPAYANGEVRQEAGGGICQVSSTLYNAVLYSNLEIVERECHQFQVAYLPWGMDATVSWGWPDFKFKNNTEYPIKIEAWVDSATNECCVAISGTDTEHVYVIMTFNNWEFYDDSGTYHDANGDPLSVGMEAATWRLVYHDGDDYNTATPISNEYEVHSKYNYHTEDIEERNVPLAPEPTPEDNPGGEGGEGGGTEEPSGGGEVTPEG